MDGETGLSDMRKLIQMPSWVYQRYNTVWERALLSAGWAFLYILCDTSLEAFPIQWRIVLAGSIFIGGLYRPVIAYAVFIAAVAYPLYLISIYVMALGLAVLILSAPVAARFLPWVLLVLCAPLLAPFYLTPILPLLAGLWWGEVGGAAVGGLAAFYLKICAAMAGYPTDLWPINGWTMSVGPVYERFHAANSLQTLLLIVGPLGTDSLFLLFTLLQVFAWTAAGYAVGAVVHRLHTNRGWAAALGLGPGLVLIWAGYVAVPVWLQIEGAEWLNPLWLPANVLLAGFVVWCLDRIQQYLQRPVLDSLGKSSFFSKRIFPSRSARRFEAASRTVKKPSRKQSGSNPLEMLKKQKEKPKQTSDDKDIIMIEFD